MQKTISFDLWGTLIKGNPEFKIKQFELVQEFTDEYTFETWCAAKDELKGYTDYMAETHGFHVSRTALYKKLFKTFSDEKINDFILRSNELFLTYPPYKTEEFDLVGELRAEGYKCVISSNTVFIYGDTLGQIVKRYFDIEAEDCNFSDTIGFAKGNKRMFEFPNKPIYHIGDNIITDGASNNYEIKHYHINSQQTLKTFFTDELKYQNVQCT